MLWLPLLSYTHTATHQGFSGSHRPSDTGDTITETTKIERDIDICVGYMKADPSISPSS